MEVGQQHFSLGDKAAVTDSNLRNEYYQKLLTDFIGPQSGEGLDLELAPCKNRFLIQVGLMREVNHFPWMAIVHWLMKLFPSHRTADFRSLIERGIATTLSLGNAARVTFLESEVNFDFVGPICDSIGVERQHLLEMRDFSEQAQLVEVTNGLILELSNFVNREKIAPVVLVTWLRNFNSKFCKDGEVMKAYKVLRFQIQKLRQLNRNYETKSHRRNTMMEILMQSPFELLWKRERRAMVKKRIRRDDTIQYKKVTIKEEYETLEIGEVSNIPRIFAEKIKKEEDDSWPDETNKDMDESDRGEETTAKKQTPLTLLDIAMATMQKLSSEHGGKNEVCRQVCFDLLKNHYSLMCKEHPAMAEFEEKLDTLSEDVSLVIPVEFLNYNAIFLVNVHDAVEKQIMSFEEEIILSRGEKLGRDKLPKFNNFMNQSESATLRYIHMACDVFSCSMHYRTHWVAFCEEKQNPSRLVMDQSNPFNNYFESAAGLIHHHNEVAPFFFDLLSLNNDKCPNVILESVAADANDSVIQSLVCVLAIVYCKILGPYWQLLKSEGEYSVFSKYILDLYQKSLDWSKDPSTLLKPEGDKNVFLQLPLQEKTFEGVFNFCMLQTNRDLIRACLKRIIKEIVAVTEEHLKVFLPGGTFSQVPSPDESLRLSSCTFSILMAEYPSSQATHYKKDEPDKRSAEKNLDESQEDDGSSSSSDISSDDSSSRKMRMGKNVKKASEERVVNMDRDYIMATVHSNQGPCKTRQDVDRMMLRLEGESKAVKREIIRCEIVYQRMILNNTNRHLYGTSFIDVSSNSQRLKSALPRVKPGYSIILEPVIKKPEALDPQLI